MIKGYCFSNFYRTYVPIIYLFAPKKLFFCSYLLKGRIICSLLLILFYAYVSMVHTYILKLSLNQGDCVLHNNELNLSFKFKFKFKIRDLDVLLDHLN